MGAQIDDPRESSDPKSFFWCVLSRQNWLKVAKLVGFQGLKTKNFLAGAR